MSDTSEWYLPIPIPQGDPIIYWEDWGEIISYSLFEYNITLDRALLDSALEAGLFRNANNNIQITSESYGNCTVESCMICRDNFESKNTITILDCGHVFHSGCIKEWGHYNPTCPLCKRKIPLKEKSGDTINVNQTHRTMEQ